VCDMCVGVEYLICIFFFYPKPLLKRYFLPQDTKDREREREREREMSDDENLKLAIRLSLEDSQRAQLRLSRSGNSTTSESGKTDDDEDSVVIPPQEKWAVYLTNPSGLDANTFKELVIHPTVGCLLNSLVVPGFKLQWNDRGWTDRASFESEFMSGLKTKHKKGLVARGQDKKEAEALVKALAKNGLLAESVNVDEPKTYYVSRKIPKRSTPEVSEYIAVDKKITIKPGGDRNYTVAVALPFKTGSKNDEECLFWYENKNNTSIIYKVLNAQDPLGVRDRRGLTWQHRGWRGGSSQFAWCAYNTIKEGMRFILARELTRRDAHLIRGRLIQEGFNEIDIGVIGVSETQNAPKRLQDIESSKALIYADKRYYTETQEYNDTLLRLRRTAWKANDRVRLVGTSNSLSDVAR